MGRHIFIKTIRSSRFRNSYGVYFQCLYQREEVYKYSVCGYWSYRKEGALCKTKLCSLMYAQGLIYAR